MANMHESIARFLGRFSQELAQAIESTGLKRAEVTWNSLVAGPLGAELRWWNGTVSGELGSAYLGADPNTWVALGADDEFGHRAGVSLPWLEQILRAALEEQFGPLEVESASPPAESPSEAWMRFAFDIQEDERTHSLVCVLNPALEAALRRQQPAAGSSKRGGPANPETKPNSAAMNPSGILMHVEVPVSISFGRTRIPMRELLSLNSGSIVELDQALGDWVELRVNNHVIALGEVVAVDGNYGVRIMELVSEQHAPVVNDRTK